MNSGPVLQFSPIASRSRVRERRRQRVDGLPGEHRAR